MNKKQRVFELVSRSLAETVNTNKTLVVLPTNLYLKGFLLESTIEKNRYFLWKLVMPLYTPASFISLSFGNRLARSKTILIEDRASSIKLAAEEVLQIITQEHALAFLGQIDTPADFLSHVRSMLQNGVAPNQLHFAATFALLGDYDKAREVLKAIVPTLYYENLRTRYLPSIEALLQAIEQGRDQTLALLADWRQVNIETLGLQEAVRLSATP